MDLTHYPPTAEGFARMETITSDMDCFYRPAYSNAAYVDQALPLDPLLAADPDFDPDDLLEGTLVQVQVDGQTLALPVFIQPTLMYANERLFDEAGLTLPDDVATIDGFAAALRQLAPLTPDQAPLYPASTMDGGHLVLLMAAYGAQPLNFSTDPPIVNFTDPDTVAGIRQVLDLAREGYIYYQPTARGIQHIEGTGQPPALLTDRFFDDGPNSFITSGDSYRLILFPAGHDITPVALGYLTTIYISAGTSHPELCYRFAQKVKSQPELYLGLPAYRSVIDSPQTLAARGPDATRFYQMYADLLAEDDTVVIQWYSPDYPLANAWLRRAFDRYVLEDADLEAELAQAEQFTRELIACEDDPEKGEPPVEGYPLCPLTIDPTFADTYFAD